MKGVHTCFFLFLFQVATVHLSSQDLESTGIYNWLPEGDHIIPGALMVPENHGDPDGPMIQITYVILKSRKQGSGSHPMIFFSGGPGGNSLGPGMINFLARHPLRESMDIILFDQRGIGLSTPMPDMSFDSFRIMAKDADEQEELELTRRMIGEYRRKCDEQGIHPAFYNTGQSAQDVGMLFVHLGYAKYNLFGGSYGTRLARVVQDLYPAYVHSSVLDSPAPLSGDFLLNRLESYTLALSRIFQYCSGTAECRAKYPELEQEYMAALSRLAAHPMKVVIHDTLDFYINGQDAVYLLRRLLYQPDAREKAPALIREFNKSPGPVVREVLEIEYQLTGGLNLTMLLSVEKFENFNPSNTREVIDQAYAQYSLLPARLGFFDAFYEAGSDWHEGHLPLGERQFDRSAVPTLIFVNRYDPVTPPENGYIFKEKLSECTLLVLDEGGHGGGNQQCKDQVVMQFMLDPGKDLDISCLNIFKE